jgi:hypothetical protein
MKHRTALITAGSIAAVVFAGAIAAGANLGILTVADSRPVGQLSAATVVQTGGPKPTQEYAGVKKAAGSQKYIIRKAGTVEVAFTKTSVRLVDVAAKRQWTWKLVQTGDRKLTVTFQHASSTYTFVAVVGRHGKLTARVDHPITEVAPAAAPASPASWVATSLPSSASSPHAGGDSEEAEQEEGGGADD